MSAVDGPKKGELEEKWLEELIQRKRLDAIEEESKDEQMTLEEINNNANYNSASLNNY